MTTMRLTLGLIVVLVAACAGATPAPTEILTTVVPPASAGDDGTPEPAGLVAAETSITDKKGDLHDENGKKVSKNPHVDVVKVTGSADGQDLVLDMTLAGKVPAQVSTIDQELNYLFSVETDHAGEFQYWILLTNVESGSWSPSLNDYTSGAMSYADERFPGSMAATGNHVMARVRLDALGNPRTVRVSVTTQRARNSDGKVLAQDEVPAGAQGSPSHDWLTLPPAG